MLIDDDGTDLLGDLGVAADLSEDPSQRVAANSHSRDYTLTATAVLDQAAQKRSVSFDGNVKPRLKIGKRKSFVGTVSVVYPLGSA